ncbi:TagF domain-containing protein [Paracoccus sp. (in: a-proteobacteria)]|uniref:TagF domain-containing protein n=1 Tax=Paracoccus sp. TaxID=267 RepID=UPI0032205542
MAEAGFWGKLPGCGDFVTRGLPETFRARWDAWASRHLAGCAPWPEGGLRLRIAGPGRVAAGLVLPSCDRSGRRFPLALFLLAEALPDPPGLEPWCDAALPLAAAGTPEALWQALADLPAPAGDAGQDLPLLLWRRGGAALRADPDDPGPALAQIFS